MKARVVFDCNVYAQALLNPRGPAGRCLDLAQAGRIDLYASEFVLSEIAELHAKLPTRLGVTAEDAEDLAGVARGPAIILRSIPAVFHHPIDPDDSEYVDLAIAAGAELIVSRDRHLLGLVDAAKPWSAGFRTRFPAMRIVSPDEFLVDLAGHPARDPQP